MLMMEMGIHPTGKHNFLSPRGCENIKASPAPIWTLVRCQLSIGHLTRPLQVTQSSRRNRLHAPRSGDGQQQRSWPRTIRGKWASSNGVHKGKAPLSLTLSYFHPRAKAFSAGRILRSFLQNETLWKWNIERKWRFEKCLNITGIFDK